MGQDDKKIDKKQALLDRALNDIYDSMTSLYKQKISHWLAEISAANALQSDVIVLIMNLSLSLGSFPLETIRIVMPGQKIDYDFIKAALVNQFSDKLEEIKEAADSNIADEKAKIILPN